MQQGKIILSCGHEDFEKPLGWTLFIKDWGVDPEDGVYDTIVSGQYCTKCFCAYVLQVTKDCWLNYEEAKEAVFGQTR